MKNSRNINRRTLYVDLSHLFEFDTNYELRELILNEYYRFQPYLDAAVEEFMRKISFEWAKDKQFNLSFYNIPHVEK
jgi:DNA replicative helicase MCM subunit Mcm2 (Cdc46/Mcm family)